MKKYRVNYTNNIIEMHMMIWKLTPRTRENYNTIQKNSNAALQKINIKINKMKTIIVGKDETNIKL